MRPTKTAENKAKFTHQKGGMWNEYSVSFPMSGEITNKIGEVPNESWHPWEKTLSVFYEAVDAHARRRLMKKHRPFYEAVDAYARPRLKKQKTKKKRVFYEAIDAAHLKQRCMNRGRSFGVFV